ncbi:MAG: hypothetical protein WBE86_17255 [Candidatus Acidiferrales bacterium]
MIKKVKGGYKVLSESGKNLGGLYKSKAQAEKRLRQVEFFKHKIRITATSVVGTPIVVARCSGRASFR